MSEPLQCPNCGGTKVASKVKVKEYGYATRPMGRRIHILTWALFVGVLLLLIAELMYIFRLNLGIAGMVTALFALMILWSKGIRTRLFERKILERVPIHAMYRNVCQLCDYQWSWHTGTPKPEVHVRPELILQGAERLSQKRRR